MKNILFISEATVKANSEISDNVYGSYLLPAIRTAQEMYLQPIIGAALYESISDKIADGSIVSPDNAAYKSLLDDYIQPYLLERVIADLVPVVSTKIANLGTLVSKDEYVSTLSEGEVERLHNFHQNKSDFYCKHMQEYLINNKGLYVELDDCACNQMKANLDSAASTSIWLGGYRSRIIR